MPAFMTVSRRTPRSRRRVDGVGAPQYLIYALGRTSSSSGTARGAGPCSLMYRWASVSSVSTAATMVCGVGLLPDRACAVESARLRSLRLVTVAMAPRSHVGCKQTECPQQGPFSWAECGVPGIAKNGKHIVSVRGGQSGGAQRLS